MHSVAAKVRYLRYLRYLALSNRDLLHVIVGLLTQCFNPKPLSALQPDKAGIA
jgi:hypothetical protein